MGNGELAYRRTLKRFHDGLAWLMQIVMFLALGLLVFPSALFPIAWTALLVSLFLIFIARPVGILIAGAPFARPLRSRLLVSWVGLRGAVPIVLATFPFLAAVPGADRIFNIVFFVVLTSALIQGTTVPWVARLLRVDEPGPPPRRSPLEFEPLPGLKNELVEVIVAPGSRADGRQVVDLGLPQGTLIVLVGREDRFFVPGRGTVLHAGDQVVLITRRESADQVRDALEMDAAPPAEPEDRPAQTSS